MPAREDAVTKIIASAPGHVVFIYYHLLRGPGHRGENRLFRSSDVVTSNIPSEVCR